MIPQLATVRILEELNANKKANCRHENQRDAMAVLGAQHWRVGVAVDEDCYAHQESIFSKTKRNRRNGNEACKKLEEARRQRHRTRFEVCQNSVKLRLIAAVRKKYVTHSGRIPPASHSLGQSLSNLYQDRRCHHFAGSSRSSREWVPLPAPISRFVATPIVIVGNRMARNTNAPRCEDGL
jgi:hypothetical protein